MACLLTQGFAWECKNDTVGVKAIYLVDFNSTDTVTKASGEITAHSLVNSRVYFKHEFEEYQAEFNQTVTPNDENGSVMYEAEAKYRLYNLSTAKRNELKLMAKTRMRAIVRTMADTYWMLGADIGARLQPSTGAAGKDASDFNGWEVVIKHKEADLPQLVQASVVTSLGLT